MKLLNVCRWVVGAALLLCAAQVLSGISISEPNDGSYTVRWSTGVVMGYATVSEKRNDGGFRVIHQGGGPASGPKSKSFSNKSPSKYTYRARITECNRGTCVTRSHYEASVQVPPSIPTGLTVPSTNSSGSFSAKWNSVSGATRYRLELRQDNGSWREVYNGSSLSKSLSTNSSGVYRYRVRSCHSWGGCSSFSSVKTVKVAIKPGVPSSLSVPNEKSDGDFWLAWGKGSGRVTSYRAQRSYTAGGWGVTIFNANGLKVKQDVQDEGVYKYRVQACNEVSGFESCSGWRTSGNVNVAKPSRPSLSLQSHSSSDNFVVSWSEIEGARHYRIEQRRTDTSGNWQEKYSNLTGTSKRISVNGSGVYQYRMRACNAMGCSAYSNSRSIGITFAPDSPGNVTVPSGQTDGDYWISWVESSSPVDHYKVERKKEGSTSWVLVENASSATAHEIGPLAAGGYRYRVRSCNKLPGYEAVCSSGVSQSSVVTVAGPDSPSLNPVANTSSDQFSLVWEEMDNVRRFEVYEKLGNDNWLLLTDESSYLTGSSTEWLAKNKESSRYQYRMKACNNVGCSGYSNILTLKVAIRPSAPTSITSSAALTDGWFSIAWGEASGRVTQYELQRREGQSGGWQTIYEKNGSSYEEAGGLSEGAYDYRVRAVNNVEGYKSFSTPWKVLNGVSVSRPDKPSFVNIPSSSTNNSYLMSWSEIENTQFYKLERVDSNGRVELVYQGTQLSVTSTPTNNDVFRYRLTACNRLGCSSADQSTVVVAVSPQPPENLVVSESPNTGQFEISWAPSQSLSSEVFYKVRNVTLGEVAQTGDLSFGYVGLSGGEYSIEVAACVVADTLESCSSWSSLIDPVVVVGRPSQPVSPTQEAVGGSGVKIGWQNAPGNPDDIYYYVIYQILGTNEWLPLLDDSGTERTENTEAVLQNLLPNKEYVFQIRACHTIQNVENCSIPLNIPEPISVPKGNLTIEVDENPSQGNYVVSWDKNLVGVEHYELVETHNGSTKNYAVTTLSLEFPSQDNGVYKYRVSACNQFFGCAEPSDEIDVYVVRTPGASSIVNTPIRSDGYHTVRWSASPGGVSYYVLEQKDGDTSWTSVYNGLQRAFDLEALSIDEYRYRVKACTKVEDVERCSAASSEHILTVTTPDSAPASIQLPALSTNGNYTLSWSEVGYTDSYRVEQLVGQQWVTVGQAEELQHVASGQPEGVYHYRISACNRAGCSAASLEQQVVVIHKPDNLSVLEATADHSDGKTDLLWSPVPQETSSYQAQVRRYTEEWPEQVVVTSQLTGFSWPAPVDDAGTYQYRVKACRSLEGFEVCSDEWITSNTVTYQLPEETGITLPFFSEDGDYKVGWSRSDYADFYEVEENGSISFVQQGQYELQETSKSSGIYIYRVRACNFLGCSLYSPMRVIMVEFKDDDFYDDDGSGDDGSESGGTGGGDGSDGDDAGASLTESGNLSGPPGYPQSNDSVGTLSGTFRVNESGAATYTIPIDLPRGTAGVSPELSLNYSSQGGNTHLGKGWSLGGSSSISRCRQTVSQDGQAAPISWNETDRFCLDGQRLMLVSGVEYGAVGAEYKTEVDSYKRIVSHGGSSGNPNTFVVESKDGSVVTYGSGASRLDVSNRNVAWAMSRLEDNMGNRINYFYETTNSNDHRLIRIDYAYSSTHSNYSPGASVRFQYSNSVRCDPVARYERGHSFTLNNLLSEISVENSGEEIKRYQLKYVGRYPGRESMLESVTLCSSGHCLPPTEFNWLGAESPESVGYRHSLKVTDMRAYTLLDMTGNGYTDIVWLEDTGSYTNSSFEVQIKYAIGGESAFKRGTVSSAGTFHLPTEKVRQVKISALDYNADGRQDVAVYIPDRGNLLYVSRPENDGTWSLQRAQDSELRSAPRMYFGDMTSNGLTDLYHMSSGVLHIRPLGKRTSGGNDFTPYEFKAPQSYSVPPPPITCSSSGYEPRGGWTLYGLASGGQVADFNGDGQADIVVKAQAISIKVGGVSDPHFRKCFRHLAYVSTPSGYKYYGVVGAWTETNPEASVLSWNPEFNLADFNGDGLTDAINYRDVYVNTGDGFKKTQMLSGEKISKRQVANVNGDPYPSILWKDQQGSNHRFRYVYWNSELENFSGGGGGLADGLDEDASYIALDTTGNNVVDLLEITTANNSTTFRVMKQGGSTSSSTAHHSVISEITDGLGKTTEISYGLMNRDSTHYSSAWGANTTSQTEERCVEVRGRYGHPTGQQRCFPVTSYTANTDDFYSLLRNPLGYLGEEFESDHPILEMTAPLLIATSVRTSMPYSGASPGNYEPEAVKENSYFYHHMRLQAGGRGSLGFEKLTVIDHTTGISETTTYRQDWPYVGKPLKTVRKTADGKILTEADNVWKDKASDTTLGGSIYQPYLWKSTEKQYDLANDGAQQGSLLKTVTTETEMDSHGNVVSLETVTSGGGKTFTKSTSHQYNGAGGGARLGRLSRTEIATSDGVDSDTRVVEFSYFSNADRKGLLRQEVVNADTANPAMQLTREYQYDDYGNQQRVTLSGGGEQRQGNLTVYEEGRYVKSVFNANGDQVREVMSRNRYGLVEAERDINRVVTEKSYDAFGRLYLQTDDTGAWSWSALRACNDGITCPDGAVYRRDETVSGGGKSRTYYDVLKRPVRTSVQGFSGGWVNEDTEYNARGQVRRMSTPYFAGGYPEGWIESRYDLRGRIISVNQPDGSIGEQTVYSDYEQTVTNALGQTKTKTHDVLGNLIEVVDNKNGSVSYIYDLQNNLIETLVSAPDAASVKVRICYDELGRKSAMHDPNKGGFLGNGSAQCSSINPGNPHDGWWIYQYNSFGDLVTQTDTKKQKAVFSYDALGRKVGETRYLANNSVESHTHWHYDINLSGTSERGEKGNLTYVVQSEGSVNEQCSDGNYCEIYVYDDLGRQTDSMTFHPGAETAYTTQTLYDSIGRAYVEKDALSSHVPGNSGILTQFNDYGYRTALVDLATNDPLHEVLAQDAWGNVTETQRAGALTSTYSYDPYFGRLSRQETRVAGASSLAIQNLSYEWDALGNLKSRHNQSALTSDGDSKDLRESFCYDGLNRLVRAQKGALSANCGAGGSANDEDVVYDGLGNILSKHDVGEYLYGANAGPNAVTQAGNFTYTYDNNGNQVSGAGRALTYNTLDKPTEVTKGPQTTTFRYGPGGARYQRTDQGTANGPVRTTTYLGSVERIETEGQNSITWRRTVAGAVYLIKTDRLFSVQGNTEKSYLFTDHLGSTDVITDANGLVKQSMSFDAWGKRRNPESWEALINAANDSIDTTLTQRGYTGHEQIDSMGLIHMGGRIYDPLLGRFLQADPFIQAADNTQSFNRYSYVWNNPLNATDPSGFFLKKLWDKVVKPLAGAIAAVVIGAVCPACAAPLIGMLSGAIGAAVNGGNIVQGAVFGAFTAGALEGGGLLGGALAGGAIAEFQGGDFISGFAAAGVGAVTGGIDGGWGFMAAAVGGGIASEITGGKFKNGAATAAFTWALSQGARKLASPNDSSRNKGGPERFSEDQKTEMLKEIELAVDADAVNEAGFESSGDAAVYLREKLQGIAEGYDIEIGAYTPEVEGRYIISDVQTTFHSNTILSMSDTRIGVDWFHTHQSSGGNFSTSDLIKSRNAGATGYLSDKSGLYRFRAYDYGVAKVNLNGRGSVNLSDYIDKYSNGGWR